MDAADPRGELSRDPVNVLLNQDAFRKKNVWDVDIVQILDLLVAILEKSGRTDLRVAGMAALNSSIIYRLKVESIFALHKRAVSESPSPRREVDIAMIGLPYRHESTYAVSLEDLLGLLENLIGAMANPRLQKRKTVFDDPGPPDIDKYLISLENIIGKYEDLVVKKIAGPGTGLLGDIAAGLDPIDRIRCFFAVLFLARDGRVELEQAGADIRITLVGSQPGRAGEAQAAEAG